MAEGQPPQSTLAVSHPPAGRRRKPQRRNSIARGYVHKAQDPGSRPPQQKPGTQLAAYHITQQGFPLQTGEQWWYPPHDVPQPAPFSIPVDYGMSWPAGHSAGAPGQPKKSYRRTKARNMKHRRPKTPRAPYNSNDYLLNDQRQRAGRDRSRAFLLSCLPVCYPLCLKHLEARQRVLVCNIAVWAGIEPLGGAAKVCAICCLCFRFLLRQNRRPTLGVSQRSSVRDVADFVGWIAAGGKGAKIPVYTPGRATPATTFTSAHSAKDLPFMLDGTPVDPYGTVAGLVIHTDTDNESDEESEAEVAVQPNLSQSSPRSDSRIQHLEQENSQLRQVSF